MLFMKKKCKICDSNVVANLTQMSSQTVGRKKQLICAFMACFMLHRFYLGRYLTGTIQILTGGGFIIWWIMDVVDIYKCKMKDSNGNKLIEHFFLP